MTYKPDDEFDYFLEKFGEPNTISSISDDIFLKYKDKLPDQLMTYWKEYGFCSFKDGLFSIVNPDDYRSTMIDWIHKTEVFKKDSFHVIARSGFGDLYLWGEKSGNSYIVEPRNSEIFSTGGDYDLISKGKADKAMQFFFSSKGPERIDLKDIGNGKLLFAKAVKRFGPLEADEMFTFVPALFVGGEQKMAHVKKENIFIQLDILAKMGTPSIMDLDKLRKKAFGVD